MEEHEKQLRILLIEDEDFIRDLYQRQLSLANLKTDAFRSGKEGLAALDKHTYDLILLDIMLPDINGLEVLKAIKKDTRSKKTPVVLLTNLGQDTIIKEGFMLGAENYLIKASYTPDQIVEKVKALLARLDKQSRNKESSREE